MAKLKHSQVSASALIEVVIAMVIIMIVFALAVNIFSGVLRSTPTLRQTYVHSIADSLIQNADENSLQGDLIVKDSLTFATEAIRLGGDSDLFKISIHVNDNGKEVGVFSRIVKLKDNDK